jgi:hypothetical protein
VISFEVRRCSIKSHQSFVDGLDSGELDGRRFHACHSPCNGLTDLCTAKVQSLVFLRGFSGGDSGELINVSPASG